eukprot:COSAG06_NODE_24734_length_654_cov_0.666667_2_plen_53_part_01
MHDILHCNVRHAPADTPLIRERLIDYIRVHMSDIGGITPMRKLATLCEFYGVR